VRLEHPKNSPRSVGHHYIPSEQILLEEVPFTVDTISRDARLAAVTILTARSDRSGSMAEELVEECALSTHLEPIRVEIGVAVMQYGLQALLDAIDEIHPGERRGLRFSPAAAGTFYDLLYQSFAKTPPPLGPALEGYSPESDQDDLVAGRVERDWPAALNAALASSRAGSSDSRRTATLAGTGCGTVRAPSSPNSRWPPRPPTRSPATCCAPGVSSSPADRRSVT
jgi:hypothetical protein